MSDKEILEMLARIFDAKIVASWTPEEWAVALEKIKRTPMRYGLGQWK